MATLWPGCKVAVIGAGGFIGSHLVERLIKEGTDLLAIGRHPGHLKAFPPTMPGYQFCVGDISDRQQIETLLRTFRPDIVFHLAAHPDGAETFPQIQERMRINLFGGMNTLEAAISCGSKVFVLADSTKSYGNRDVPYTATQLADPLCSYAVAKTALWQLCQLVARMHEIQVVGLRLTFVYGPRQGWNIIRYVQKCLREGTPVALQGGTQTRDPLYIDDAVDALLAAATQPAAFGHSIPIGGGKEISIRSLCESVLQMLGPQLPIIENADTLRLTEIWRSVVDNTDARRLLNWVPRTTLAEGLTKTLQPIVVPDDPPTAEQQKTRHSFVDTSEL